MHLRIPLRGEARGGSPGNDTLSCRLIDDARMQSSRDEHAGGIAVVEGYGGAWDGGLCCRASSNSRETEGKVSDWYCFRLPLSESRKDNAFF